MDVTCTFKFTDTLLLTLTNNMGSDLLSQNYSSLFPIFLKINISVAISSSQKRAFNEKDVHKGPIKSKVD